jgi:hypothetical protein
MQPVSARLFIYGRPCNARAFASIKDAKAYYAEQFELPIKDNYEVSVNVYETPSTYFYEVDDYNWGTNTRWDSIDSIDMWWNDDWNIQVNEPHWDEHEEDFWLTIAND